MQNPYEILGINEGASQEQIKAAYREQVKKYHPDKHQDNPLQELAEEKLQEINWAYDYLTKNGGSGDSGYQNSGNTSSYAQNSRNDFTDVRVNIDRGNIIGAEKILLKMSPNCGEWYFLKGMISVKKGWYDDAMQNIQTAMAMEPNNFEYKRAFQQLNAASGSFRGAAYNRGYGANNGACEMCQCLICSDCCCECFGGDIISCC